MKKYIFSLLASLFLFASCSSSDDNDPKELYNEDSLTILSYMIASGNGLNQFMSFNITTMYDGLASMDKPATLIVYWDGDTRIGENKKTHLMLKYETDGKGNVNGKKALDTDAKESEILAEAQILKEYEPQVCTDKDVMKQVLKDMKSFAPTDKLGLIVGAHGSSWLNTISTSRAVARAIGYDGNQSNSILLPDMVEALESIGKKFEFILFDACFMGTAEACYYFHSVSDYLIASVMEVPAYGFPYDWFMKYLYQDTEAGYRKVCECYIDYYKDIYNDENSSESAWGTIALVDCKEVPALTERIKEEIASHKSSLTNYDADELQEYGRYGGYGIAYDLEQFVKDLNGGESSAFKAQLDKTILYKGCVEEARSYRSGWSYDVDASNFCGLGIYIPGQSYSKWNTYFKTIDWFTASGWSTVDFGWNF